MTALGLRFFLLLGVLLGILAPEAVALVPKKQLVSSGFAVTFAELPPPSHNCDLLTKTTYGYDANGNRLTRKIGPNTDLYSYDFENWLTALTKTTAGGEGSYEYTYDYRTRRVYRAEAPTNGPNVETQIVFSGGTSIQEITLGNTPELAVEYIRGSDYGGGIGGILYTIRDSTPSFTHYNHRGDIVSKTDDNGIITYEAQYEAFGTRLTESGTTEDRQKTNTKDEDPTGLLNEGFRYRDLETGTFLTRDPLGFVDGPNMYAYVMQNPWTKFDPLGLAEKDKDGVRITRDGHHITPVENWRDNDAMSPDVRSRLDEHRIKPVEGDKDTKVKHGWSKAHELYNEKTIILQDEFLDAARKSGIDPSKLKGGQAKDFADNLIKHTIRDEYIAGFNALIREGKGTTKELNKLRASYLKASGTAGWLLKFRAGKAMPVIATAASVGFLVSDAIAGGPEYAAGEFIKSASFYDVTIKPIRKWHDKTYQQAKEGKLNPNNPIGNYLNTINQLKDINN